MSNTTLEAALSAGVVALAAALFAAVAVRTFTRRAVR
jgi:hypothetical protein